MFDHVKFGVSDYAASKAFFLAALAPLGVEVVSEGSPTYGAELCQKGGTVSLCLFQTAEKPAHLHVAFKAQTRQQVDAFYREALAAGGKDNGPPGLRPKYHPNYYAAFVIGPDGHNIEAVCHERPEIDALREIYDGINRNDIESAVEPLDPEIDWIEPAEYTGSATCHGIEAVAAHLKKARATWAEGRCETEDFIAVGDKIVVIISVHVRLESEAEFRDGRHAAVYTFRNGKAREMRIIDDPREAVEWARKG